LTNTPRHTLLIMKLTAWPIHHATHDIQVCKAAFISLTECIIYLCSEYFSVLTMFLTSTIMHVCTRLQSDTMLQVSCLALIFLLLIVVRRNCTLLMNNYFSDKENNKIKKKNNNNNFLGSNSFFYVIPRQRQTDTLPLNHANVI
jgi:hypothetical protein